MLVNIQQRAEEDLSYIRQVMARAEGLSTVSGWAIFSMGVVALLAGALGGSTSDLGDQLKFWLACAPVAAVIGIGGSLWKSRQRETEPLRDPARRFLLCLLPPAGVAAIFTHLLWSLEQIQLLPSLWLLLYGCGVLAAGTYAVRPVAVMGAAFLVCGTISMTLPLEWLNTMMTVSFGLLHLYFGWQVAKHHGG